MRKSTFVITSRTIVTRETKVDILQQKKTRTKVIPSEDDKINEEIETQKGTISAPCISS